MKPKVLFVTKTWQGDYKQILSGGFDRKIRSCEYPFDERWLIINNIDDPIGIEAFGGIADRVILASDYAKKALDFFNLTEDDFKGGLVYSICELVELYLAAEFDYLCHFSSDSLMSPSGDWITPGLEILRYVTNVSVISPASEVNTWHDRNSLDQFFSDQCYLIDVKEWRKPIYSEPGTIPEYPAHGGNDFEHMAAKYLRKTDRYRMILEDYGYAHPAY